ncbi:hypothetical protein BGZ58_010721 [Dissophora ornata]|nr:hypothetical protein BGZ58_010721 [Dissophora ornata]
METSCGQVLGNINRHPNCAEDSQGTGKSSSQDLHTNINTDDDISVDDSEEKAVDISSEFYTENTAEADKEDREEEVGEQEKAELDYCVNFSEVSTSAQEQAPAPAPASATKPDPEALPTTTRIDTILTLDMNCQSRDSSILLRSFVPRMHELTAL